MGAGVVGSSCPAPGVPAEPSGAACLGGERVCACASVGSVIRSAGGASAVFPALLSVCVDV